LGQIGARSDVEDSVVQKGLFDEGEDILGEEQEFLAIGRRVLAKVTIRYQTATIKAGRPGTVLEVTPQMMVQWDDLAQDGVMGSIVKRSQVEALAPTQPKRGATKDDTCQDEHDEEGCLTARREREEFRVVLERRRPRDSWGLGLDRCDNRFLHVSSVKTKGSVASKYNRTAHPELQLRPNDYIVEVNGIQGAAKTMAKEVKSGMRLELVVRRPSCMLVQLSKKNGALGLGLNHSSRSTSIVVEAVLLDGAASAWNREHPDKDIRRGDRITAVNGMKAGPAELLHRLSKDSTIELLISRPAGAPMPCANFTQRSACSSTTAPSSAESLHSFSERLSDA